MAITRIDELNDLAKDFYSSVYINLVNPETPLKAQFSRLENAMFTGKKWIFGVKTEIGGGAANVGARLTLPTETQGTFDQGNATVVRTYTVMALDGLAIEVTKKQAGSYKPALAEVMQDRLQAHDLDVNRQLYNKNGVLAILKTDSATDQVMEKAYGVANGGPGAKFFYPGDQIQAYASIGGAARTKATVTAVNHATDTVTFSVDPVTTQGDVFVKATDDTDNSVAGEANGLLKSVSAADDDFEGIDTSVHGRWKSYVLGNSETLRPVSDSLVMQMISVIRQRSRLSPNLIVTTPGIVLKYSELFLPLRRLDGQDVQLKGGYKPIAAVLHAGGSIPVIADSDCPASRMFFLNTGAFRMADLVGTEWAELDGAMFDRVSNKDSITGYIRKYWNLITVHRSANGVLEDLEDVAAIAKRF